MGTSRIRKVNTSGIISTIAGNGAYGYIGDGGPATTAKLNSPQDVTVDPNGNIYISDGQNNRIRKVNSACIINTITGNGTEGYAGDGGPADSAEIAVPSNTQIDPFGNLYICDAGNSRIRRVSSVPDILSDSFIVYINRLCSGPEFTIKTNTYYSGLSVETYFGDGQSNITSIIPGYGAGYASIYHSYNAPGTYTVKQVMLNGLINVDSIQYSYEYLLCNNYSLKFYDDYNGDCIKEASEPFLAVPILMEVDSNSIPIDTISGTSGIYYSSFGLPGDVYSFKVISTPPGLYVSCPSSGIITDTIQIGIGNNPTQYFALRCAPGVNFDIAGFSSMIAGRHMASGSILVNNSYCNPENTTVRLQFGPQYIYESAYPTPDSVVGNTIIWNLGNISSTLPAPPLIGFTLTVPTPWITSTWLTPGDTINSMMIANPVIGDIDTTNNVFIINDTVKSSYDPNEMSAIPGGYILPGMELQYTINFENTGNDTAVNIYVMDTLSENVDPHSLTVIAASAVMNISIFNDGANNIVKFDFPNINLLDSSYHNQCNGLVIFNIKTKTGLADGTTIFNHAGIFFDDNPVVMTDTVENIIGLIHGVSSICVGSDTTLIEVVTGGTWSSSNSNAIITAGMLAGISSGTDTISYTVINQFGTVSTATIITVNPLPNAGVITGPDSVCAASNITLTDAATGGIWSTSNISASVLSGIVSGLSTGIDTINYLFTNVCGSASTEMIITINPLPIAPASITGISIICSGDTTTLHDLTAGDTWSSSIVSIASISATGFVNGGDAGTATISYTATNSCGSAAAATVVTVNPLPVIPAVITGTSTVCVSESTTLSDLITGGIWSSGATSIATVGSTGVVTGIGSGTAIISYIEINSCGSVAATTVVTISPLPIAPAAITGISTICSGDTTVLSDPTPGDTWSSIATSIAAVSSTGVLTGVGIGTATISYTETNSCGSAAATVIVTVNPLPITPTSIGGIPTICNGSTTTLSDVTAGDTWSSGTPSIATVSSTGVVTGVNPGTALISYTETNSCGSAEATIIVTVNPLTIANFTDTGISTLGFTYTGSTTGIDSMVWSFGDGNVSTATNPIYTYTVSGVYHVCVTVYNSCGVDSACNNITVTVPGTSVSMVSVSNVRVYPNPTNDELYITGLVQNTSYRVLNISGECMLQGTLVYGSNTLSMKTFAPGVYVLEMTGADGERNMVRVARE